MRILRWSKFVVLFSLMACIQVSAGDLSAPAQSRTLDDAKMDMLVSDIQQEIKNKKFERAPLLFNAAKKGSAKACNQVGWLFEHGITVKQNSSKALMWFMSCAKANPLAAYNAGVLYSEGRGTAKDKEKAVMLFKLASETGGPGFRALVPQLPIRLAYHFQKLKETGDALAWAEKAADVDAKQGKYLVARMMIDGTAPYSDDVRAREYLHASIEAGNGAAAALLSWCYGTGKSAEKNYLLAREYELIAAKLDPRNIPTKGSNWENRLSKDERDKANGFANNWMATHKTPAPMNFVATLDGTEAQFRK